MGGGDLNMKKSWHPLLMKNQERVWLEEKKALEEKKKLDQLRKEKEEERQLQELQRLQEEQTGKKRTEKLEWMYATPATGSNANPNDLEDYLLGRKRVDKILTADDNAKLGASHQNFIATQQANTVRDTAAKIREDPLFAIKQQEQAALQALMSNPLRLREMQERNGIKPSKKEKKEKKEKKRHRHRDNRSRSRSPRRRTRSVSPPRRSSHREHDHDSRRRRSRSPQRGRSYSRERSDSRERTRRRSDDGHRASHSSQSEGSDERRPRNDARREWGSGDRGHGGYHRERPPSPPRRDLEADRAARLAAMTSNATAMQKERTGRLARLVKEEEAELEREERARKQSQGMSSFLSAQQRQVYSGEGGLEERLRRGRGTLVSVAD